MKNLLNLLIASLVLFSCNQEKLKLKGKVEGLQDGQMIVKMKTNKAIAEKNIDTIQVKGEKFEFRTEDIKPPVRFTMYMNEDCKFDVWIGKYGSFSVKGSVDKATKLQVSKDDLTSEYYAYNERLETSIMKPLKEKMEWVKQKNEQVKEGEKLSQDDEFKMAEYKDDIHKALSRRRMSIIKTARANPTSPVIMAVVQNEYPLFSDRHKIELKKLFRKRFSDSGLYWQLCP